MVRVMIRMAGLAVLLIGLSAGAAEETVGFKFETNHRDALYQLGEEAVFTVTATNGAGGKVTAGRYTARLDNYGPKVLATEQIDLATTNPFVMKGTLNEPGFMRLAMSGPNIGTRSLRRWGVGYEPEKIRPGGTCPTDFDEFWKSAREKFAREVPVDPRVERVPERSQGAFDFYRVSFAALGGTRIWGFLSVPKDKSKAPFPVVFEAPSAGRGRWCMDVAGRADCIMMYMTIHEFEPPRQFEDLPACFEKLQQGLVARGQVSTYSIAGLDGTREDYYFYRVILGLDRAVDWLWARDDVDRSNFCYTGGSQGGYLGWCLLGLNHKFTSAVLRVPAGSDTRGYLAGRAPAWPNPIASYGKFPKETRAVVERNMGYYDGVSFAPRITCPIRVSVGFIDDTCPPSAVYATFNMLGSRDKQILNAIGCGHGGQTRHYDEIARHWQESAWKK